MSYTTPSAVRARMGGCQGWNDTQIQPYIDRASAFIDLVTGWWFEPRELVLDLDGYDDVVLQLPVPICEITKIEIIDTGVAVSGGEISLDALAVYNRHLTQRLTNPDDRKNPKIAFRGWMAGTRIPSFDSWPEGHQNIRITGWFGFTEYKAVTPPAPAIPHGVTPSMIEDVCARLVLRDLPAAPTGVVGPRDPAWYEMWMRSLGRVTREKVRDQEIDYAPPGQTDGNTAGVITGDPYIDMILLAHSKPSAMRTVP